MDRHALVDPSPESAPLAAEYGARLSAELAADRVPSRLRERFEECIRELEAAPARASAPGAIAKAVQLLDVVAFRR